MCTFKLDGTEIAERSARKLIKKSQQVGDVEIKRIGVDDMTPTQDGGYYTSWYEVKIWRYKTPDNKILEEEHAEHFSYCC